jgi:hypothetical protein
VSVDRLAWILAAVFAAFGVLQTLRLWWQRGVARRRLARARKRGRAGEQAALALVERSGFVIDALQPARQWTIVCDGEAQAIELRADLLVSRAGRKYVAEVKTGTIAPHLQTSATRRQLLEYSVAYGVDGVLLVDVEAQRIHEVSFPRALPRARALPLWRLTAVVFAVVLVWTVLYHGGLR